MVHRNLYYRFKIVTIKSQTPPQANLRRKPERRESTKKSVRNSLIGSLGLGSHKEEKDDLKEDHEKVKLKQENEWLNRQNKSLQENLALKVCIFLPTLLFQFGNLFQLNFVCVGGL